MTISNSKNGTSIRQKILMYVPFFRSGRSQNSYLRLCAFLRFFRDFFLPGVCKVGQQNACTSKIPIMLRSCRSLHPYGRSAGLYKRLVVFIKSGKSHTYKSGKEHQPDSPNSVYIEGEGNRYGQQAVFCHVSSLTDIKFDTGSFLGKLFQAFAGS